MRLPRVITIDGPAAAGKSTLGHLLAQRLGYTYFDTGVLYRAVTSLALKHELPLDDESKLTTLAQDTELTVTAPTVDDGRQYTVLADGDDITQTLRTVEVDRNVSIVSAYPQVRAALREQQRRIGNQGNIVMVGRDIGSVVMPDADLKVYLQASVSARASRRHVDVQERGDNLARATVEADIVRRDALDARNTFQPEDAWVLDTDRLTPEQEVELILEWIEAGRWRPTPQTGT